MKELSPLGAPLQNMRRMISPLVFILLTVYFVYHILQGERGVISWISLSQKVKAEEKVLQTLTSQEQALAQRVRLLRPDSLDLDMLDEQARRLLNYSHKQETVIYDHDLENSQSSQKLAAEHAF